MSCTSKLGAVAIGLGIVTLGSYASAADYHVGPSQSYTAIGQVPWESLSAGDRVLIHHRPQPYAEKWVIGRSGSSNSPIEVVGIPGPNGERPVITGDGATTRSALSFWADDRAVIKVGGASVPNADTPSHIVIEGLEIRSAHPSYRFTDESGNPGTYSDAASAIYIEQARDVTIRDCALHDSGNGLFVSIGGGETADIVVEDSLIYGNGIVNSIYQHNAYTAALGIVFQGNYFGPLRPGAAGNNLKDRSAGTVIRNNWIESGNRQLDLVDGEDDPSVVVHPDYDETFVYGNYLIEDEGSGNNQVVHYGGDSGTLSDYRKGTLYFFHNTVVSTRSGKTVLLRLSTNQESAYVANNILFAQPGSAGLAILDETGQVTMEGNLIQPGWFDSFGTLAGTIVDQGNLEVGGSFGFVDELNQDFSLSPGSPAVDAAVALSASVPAVRLPVEQYIAVAARTARTPVGPYDIGAHEVELSTSRPSTGTGGSSTTGGEGAGGSSATGGGATTAGSGSSSGSATGGGINSDDIPLPEGCNLGGTAPDSAAIWLIGLGLAVGARRRRQS